MANRSLQAKALKARRQRIEAGRLEGTKFVQGAWLGADDKPRSHAKAARVEPRQPARMVTRDLNVRPASEGRGTACHGAMVAGYASAASEAWPIYRRGQRVG